jgi:hypothetical protein
VTCKEGMRLFIAYLQDEDIDAWRYYLKQEQFEQALQTCKTDKQRSFAASFYGDFLFNKGVYDRAAE